MVVCIVNGLFNKKLMRVTKVFDWLYRILDRFMVLAISKYINKKGRCFSLITSLTGIFGLRKTSGNEDGRNDPQTGPIDRINAIHGRL